MAETTETVKGGCSQISQHNHQTLHVHIHQVAQGVDRAGKIVGTALCADGSIPYANCEVRLFFGPIGEHPVATTVTDSDGGFSFDDLPPGFYGVRLCLPNGHLVDLCNLRVRSGEVCQPRILLEGAGRLRRFSPISVPAETDTWSSIVT